MDGGLEKPVKKMLDLNDKKGVKSKAIHAKMGTKLIKGKGREGSMEYKATGIRNSRALLD